MNIILVGNTGAMGKEIALIAKNKTEINGINSGKFKINIVAKVNSKDSFKAIKIKNGKIGNKKIDCIIDFSHHKATNALCDFAVKHKIPTVVATTGQNATERKKLLSASTKIPLFYASNYAMGVALLIRLAQQSALIMKGADIEIIETHHNRKIDAPSGTALSLANGIAQVIPGTKIVEGRSGHSKRKDKDISISSVRMGNIVGTHEVILNTGNESISLKHTAHSREIFAEGSIVAASFLLDKKAGLYTMSDMIDTYV